VSGGTTTSAPPYVNKANRRRDATGSAGARPSEQLPLDDDANNDDEGHGGASLSPTAPMFEVSKLSKGGSSGRRSAHQKRVAWEAALEGSGNLLEMSLSMLRATTASLASQLVQGYSPPPVTMALVEAAGKWSSNALSFELFRASLPDDEDLRDMVERAALGRREALAGSIAASALADSLRRSGVPGAEISQTFLLTGVPTTITVGKAEQQQVLHRVIRTGEYGQVLACAQLSALSVHGNVHSCSLDLHLLILALDAQLLNTHTLATLFTWEQLPAPSSEKRYKIDCRGLGGIKTVSKSDLRHLVDVQKVYNGTKLTFAPHQMHVLHAVEVEGFVLAVQTEYPANGSLANGLTADVTQQATNSLVDKLSAVKNNLVHGKQLAAFIAAMLASLGYNR